MKRLKWLFSRLLISPAVASALSCSAGKEIPVFVTDCSPGQGNAKGEARDADDKLITDGNSGCQSIPISGQKARDALAPHSLPDGKTATDGVQRIKTH